MKEQILNGKQRKTIRIFKEYWASITPGFGRSSWQGEKVIEDNKTFKPLSTGICSRDA